MDHIETKILNSYTIQEAAQNMVFAARLVLFATPPFWFAIEITLHILFSSIYFSQFSFCQIFNNAIISRFIMAGVYLLGKYL